MSLSPPSTINRAFPAPTAPTAPIAAGEDGRHAARPIPVLAKQIAEPFTAARSAGGDVPRGNAGNWLSQYGPGDFGVAEQQRFETIYRKIA